MFFDTIGFDSGIYCVIDPIFEVQKTNVIKSCISLFSSDWNIKNNFVRVQIEASRNGVLIVQEIRITKMIYGVINVIISSIYNAVSLTWSQMEFPFKLKCGHRTPLHRPYSLVSGNTVMALPE